MTLWIGLFSLPLLVVACAVAIFARIESFGEPGGIE